MAQPLPRLRNSQGPARTQRLRFPEGCLNVCPSTAVEVVAGAKLAQPGAIRTDSHDRRPGRKQGRWRRLPRHDDVTMPGHRNPPRTSLKMLHFGQPPGTSRRPPTPPDPGPAGRPGLPGRHGCATSSAHAHDHAGRAGEMPTACRSQELAPGAAAPAEIPPPILDALEQARFLPRRPATRAAHQPDGGHTRIAVDVTGHHDNPGEPRRQRSGRPLQHPQPNALKVTRRDDMQPARTAAADRKNGA